MAKRDRLVRNSEVWGVPDWHDARAYPVADQLTLLGWWWEFTRRRPVYRTLWARKKEHPSELDKLRMHIPRISGGEDIATRELSEQEQIHLDIGMYYMLPPDRIFPDAVLQNSVCAVAQAALRYDDILMMQARLMSASEFDFELMRRRELERLRKERGLVELRFDVSRPLQPQLARARERLKFLQKDRVIHKLERERKHWPLYLRLIDARDSSPRPTFKKIAQKLWPTDFETGVVGEKTEKSAQKIHKRACMFRDKKTPSITLL